MAGEHLKKGKEKKKSIFTERRDLKKGYQCQKRGTERLALIFIFPRLSVSNSRLNRQ